MKLDLLGGIVKMDAIPNNAEIHNGTIILTDVDYAIDAKKHSNIKLVNNKIMLVKYATKWQYIKCCLMLAWERLLENK